MLARSTFPAFALFLGVLCTWPAASIARAQSAMGPEVLPPPSVSSPELAFPQAASSPPDVSTHPQSVIPQEAVEQPELALTPVDVAITPTPSWYQPAYWFGPEPWESNIELGLNGSEGNNKVLSMRAGGTLNRKTENWKIASHLQYNKNTANSIETQNDAKFDARFDRRMADTPWTLFSLNSIIYDEFQAFDLMISLDSGVGYKFVDTELLHLLGRFGAGVTREFGGPDNQWAPQTLFGMEYEHKITPLQRLVAKVDYFPEWEDYRNYRVVSDLGWEIDLDKPKNVSLKFSLVDRYDSTPNGVDPNNLDYAMLLIWGL